MLATMLLRYVQTATAMRVNCDGNWLLLARTATTLSMRSQSNAST